MALALLAPMAIVAEARAAAPGNDAFAAAEVLSGPLPIAVAGTNVEATTEPGEPNRFGSSGASVWYRWTPTESAEVTAHTCGSSFDTLLAVYTGSVLDGLVTVAENDDGGCGSQSIVTFGAVAGTEYRIAVDGYNGFNTSQGLIALTLEQPLPPSNDNFAAAEVLGGLGTVEGSNFRATTEPGEPVHAGIPGGASVWYAWTPAESGIVVIDMCASFLDAVVAVYTGDTLEGLTLTASDDDGCGLQSRARFAAVAGTTYRIAVDGFEGAQDFFTLSLRSPPANDDFASAQIITGAAPIAVEGSNISATLEAGEPIHDSAEGASVWYAWTPLQSQDVVVHTCGSGLDTVVDVYTGDTVEDLSPAGDHGRFCGSEGGAFTAVAGTTYRIVVDGSGAAQGRFTLLLEPQFPPLNDHFAEAELISGTLPITVEGSNIGASLELDEPDHRLGPEAVRASVWYEWTPAQSQDVAIHTCGSSFDTVVAVYTGDVLDGLTHTATGDDGCGEQASVTFAAVAGTTYRIAVSGTGRNQGRFVMSLQPPPANDDFAAAEVISGMAPTTVEGSNIGATWEPGEPDHADGFGGASVWYSWTPVESQEMMIHSCDADFNRMFAIYTGDTVDGLTTVDRSEECENQTSVTFDAVAGTTYRIAVDGFGGDQGRIALRFERTT